MMTLTIDGVSVDINQVEESYAFDDAGIKQLLPEELINTEMKRVDDINFPVQNRENLIAYKKIVNRDTDITDVAEMLKNVQ